MAVDDLLVLLDYSDVIAKAYAADVVVSVLKCLVIECKLPVDRFKNGINKGVSPHRTNLVLFTKKRKDIKVRPIIFYGERTQHNK